MEGVVNCKRYPAMELSKEDKYVVTRRGQKQLRKNIIVWKLLIRWMVGSESWIHLKDIKYSHPIEVSEFSKDIGIAYEPSFEWCVPNNLLKKYVFLTSVKSRIIKTTHKYGIELPTRQAHAYAIETMNNNTFGINAINKEMLNVGIDFEVLPTGESYPPG